MLLLSQCSDAMLNLQSVISNFIDTGGKKLRKLQILYKTEILADLGHKTRFF